MILSPLHCNFTQLELKFAFDLAANDSCGTKSLKATSADSEKKGSGFHMSECQPHVRPVLPLFFPVTHPLGLLSVNKIA